MALQPNFDKASFNGSRARHFAPRPSKAPATIHGVNGAFPSSKCRTCGGTGHDDRTGGEWDEILETFCECQIGQELQRAEDEIFGAAA